jgi:ribosome maturation factor RimP
MTVLDNELQNLLAPVVTALGYELVGVVCLSQGGHQTLLRVYIDSPDGIKIEDCERVSYQVSGVLEVHDPIAKEYTLEVSSPGLDRPLFTLEHFIQFVGHQVKVCLARPISGRRHFTGMLQRVQDRNVIVEADGTEYDLPYDQIDKAHLVPSF